MEINKLHSFSHYGNNILRRDGLCSRFPPAACLLTWIFDFTEEEGAGFSSSDMKHPAASQMNLCFFPPVWLTVLFLLQMFTVPWLYLTTMNWCNALRFAWIALFCLQSFPLNLRAKPHNARLHWPLGITLHFFFFPLNTQC